MVIYSLFWPVMDCSILINLVCMGTFSSMSLCAEKNTNKKHKSVRKLFFVMHMYCNAGNITKEAGPVSMTFTIPMYNASRLQVRIFLDLART